MRYDLGLVVAAADPSEPNIIRCRSLLRFHYDITTLLAYVDARAQNNDCRKRNSKEHQTALKTLVLGPDLSL